MATASRFQTRVFTNETRLNSLLAQAEGQLQRLNDFQKIEYENDQSRRRQLDLWSSKMFEKIDRSYHTSLNELKQSFEQLKLFQQMMIDILNHAQENQLDGKKLLAIEHEICILRCLTYQLDTSKMQIQGKLKLQKTSEHHEQCRNTDEEEDYQTNRKKIREEKEFNCRLLMDKDSLEKIVSLNLPEECLRMTSKPTNENTPERILTILGPNHLNVIEQILTHLYASSINPCELRILLHQSYAPLILGKLGDRSKILREKYSLHTLTIHPTCAPRSTERVLLIQSSTHEKILSCLEEIFLNINQNLSDNEEILLYDETNYDASLAHEYGGFASSELLSRISSDPHEHYDEDEEEEDEGVRRYSAFDAWNGSVEADTDHEISIVKIGEDSIIREFWINHGQFGALLGPHGVRIAQIRSQCRTVRIHTVAGSSIDTCSVKVIGPRVDVNHAVNLIFQSIKEHDRKFPFKHHRFSGRLR